MSKFIRKNITVDAVELQFPIALTTPKGVLKGQPGDYLVSIGNKEQIIVSKSVFELTYESQMNPDLLAPLEISSLSVADLSDTSVVFRFLNPYDADFKEVVIYQDGVEIGRTTEETLEITGLTAQTQYTFLFTTEDTSGNESSGIARVVTTNATPVAP